VEQEPLSGEQLATELTRDAQVEVVWCRNTDGSVNCVQSRGEPCPLADPVAFVLDVRSGVEGGLSSGEAGVVCAEALGVPVIVAGPTRPTSHEASWAAASVALGDAASFCGHLLNHTRAYQELRVEHQVRSLLRRYGEDVGDLEVKLVRWPSSTVVVVRSGRLPSTATCDAIDAALRAARPPLAEVVGVSFTTHRDQPL
jgi:hypothetical protein